MEISLEKRLTYTSGYGRITFVAKLLSLDNLVAVVKRLTRRIVAPLLEGSIPSSHPIIIRFLSLGRRQVGKARDVDSRMRWFESSRPSQCDPLAQSVEHLTFNQGVPRSSRGWITIFFACLRVWRNWQTH